MSTLADLDQLRALGYTVGAHPSGGRTVSGHGRDWLPMNDIAATVVMTEATNQAAMEQKLADAIAFFSDNYANWATMTNAQKDTAMKQSQRALANLCRYVRGDLASAGD